MKHRCKILGAVVGVEGMVISEIFNSVSKTTALLILRECVLQQRLEFKMWQNL